MTLILQSLRHYWKSQLGLLLGVFLSCAILSGSLVIGDSVRASLRRVAELRLGKIQSGLVGGDRWFTDALATKAGAAPLIQMSGSASVASGAARANAIQVLGVSEAFWKLSPRGNAIAIANDELAINEPLARKLGVKPGDTLIVRVEKPSAISRDAPLSGSTNEQITLRRKIASVISAEDFGAFQLTASQRTPDTVFMPLKNLAVQVEKEERVNGALSTQSSAGHAVFASPSLADFSLRLTRIPGAKPEWEISTDRVFLDETIAAKLLKLPGAYGVLTYLVNGVTSAKGATPYSMVTAIDPANLKSQISNLKSSNASITQWLAEDQNLALGDTFEIRYFIVGLGRELKEEKAAFTVGEILPMTDPRVSKAWTPEFPGVSDVDNCRDWDPGFPMDTKAIRDKDEKYWDDHKGTPKAFIGLQAGQKIWSNRFGGHTAIRFADAGQGEEQLRREIASQLSLADIGLVPRDFASDAAAAAQGSVDFGGLFIGLSFFLIVAALIFAGLLFVFTIERRASQTGLLLAVGWPRAQVRRAMFGEACLVALIGSVLGLAGGIAYTRGALAGLAGVWSGAAQGLELVYEGRPLTLLISFAASLGMTGLTLWLASRRLFRQPARSLLAGEIGSAPHKSGKAGRFAWLKVALCLALAIGLAIVGGRARDAQMLAGMFFGAGALLMIAGLMIAGWWLRRDAGADHVAASLWEIGARNVSRRPSRSLAVLGMTAGGIFLVMAVNAFRMGAGADASRRDSGTGGFALVGESSLPVYDDLNAKAGRDAFGLDQEVMKSVSVVPFRVRAGDDASCLNLNRAQNPVLTGVDPAKLASRGAFRFAGSGSWEMLDSGAEGVIPAIADQATAMWGLGKGVGDVLDYQDGHGRAMPVRIVALLAGSVLQGKMIIAEKHFLQRFPDAAGYKFFLVDAPRPAVADASAHLTRQLEARGLALESASARLGAFNAVQNTYIGIFTVLGGLGVLLGTAGLGVLLARHVLERKGELGLMQAIGSTPGALRRMILGEHVVLLVGGVFLGLISAALAVWPNLRQGGGDVPVGVLASLLAAILVFGILVCAAAAWSAVRGRLTDAIRRE